MRCLVETTAENACHNGTITKTERVSINALNGHNGKTSKDFYQKLQRERDVKESARFMEIDHPAFECSKPISSPNSSHSSKVFTLPKRGGIKVASVKISIPKILATASKNSAILEKEDDADIDEAVSRSEWGRLHTHYASASEKVPWSAEELEFIGQWTREAQRMGFTAHSIGNKCREALVLYYKDFHQYFHRAHVLTSARFVHGLRRYLQLQDEEEDRVVVDDSARPCAVIDLVDSDEDSNRSHSIHTPTDSESDYHDDEDIDDCDDYHTDDEDDCA